MTPLRFLRTVAGGALIAAAFVAQLIADVFSGVAEGLFAIAERVLP